MIPGEIDTIVGDIELNAGLPTTTLTVANTGDRPIQSAATIISPKPTRPLPSTAPPPTASASTSPLAPPCASSQARPATSPWSRSRAAGKSMAFAAT